METECNELAKGFQQPLMHCADAVPANMWRSRSGRTGKNIFGVKRNQNVRQRFPTAKSRPLERRREYKTSRSRPLDHRFMFCLLGCLLHQRLSSGCAWVDSGRAQSAGRHIVVRTKLWTQRFFRCIFSLEYTVLVSPPEKRLFHHIEFTATRLPAY